MNQFLKFAPILKEKIWGGEKLVTLLQKASDRKTVGESWELSDVEGDTSVVTNGALKGKNLRELIQEHREALVGTTVYKNFGDKFPLLIKFIDAKKALSIQLHPHDDLAKKRHNSFGKTEMWYVMQADEKANLIVGYKKDVSKEEYLYHLNNKSLTDILNIDPVKRGDVYYIPTGRIHAIGAGVMLAEIQQTSDITYRVYDWDRQDTKGNYRALHTEEAIDAIDYKARDTYKTSYKKNQNHPTEIVSCPYFTTNVLPVDQLVEITHDDKSSFVIYMCVKGQVTLSSRYSTEPLKMGETLLVPASIKTVMIHPNQPSELLEVYIR